MAASNLTVIRRSSRVPITVPILVTSMEEPQPAFSEVCETLMGQCARLLFAFIQQIGHRCAGAVSKQRRQLDHGPYCGLPALDSSGWMLGAKLEKPTTSGIGKIVRRLARLLEMPSLPNLDSHENQHPPTRNYESGCGVVEPCALR